MTGTNTITTTATNIQNLDCVGYSVSWTGTPTGTISVLASVTGKAGTYYPLTFNPILAQPAGAAGGYLIALREIPYGFTQISYTNASGSGVLSVDIIGKDFN